MLEDPSNRHTDDQPIELTLKVMDDDPGPTGAGCPIADEYKVQILRWIGVRRGSHEAEEFLETISFLADHRFFLQRTLLPKRGGPAGDVTMRLVWAEQVVVALSLAVVDLPLVLDMLAETGDECGPEVGGRVPRFFSGRKQDYRSLLSEEVPIPDVERLQELRGAVDALREVHGHAIRQLLQAVQVARAAAHNRESRGRARATWQPSWARMLGTACLKARPMAKRSDIVNLVACVAEAVGETMPDPDRLNRWLAPLFR